MSGSAPRASPKQCRTPTWRISGCGEMSGSTLQHEGRRLPPGWVKCESGKYGKPYFFDTQTGKSVWFPPEASRPPGGTGAQQQQAYHDHGDSSHHGSSAQRGHGDSSPPPLPPPAKRSRQQPPLPPSPSPPLPPPPLRAEESGAFANGDSNGGASAATSGPSDGESTSRAAAAESGRVLKVAVIVPYRDLEPAQKRSEHLKKFVPYMEGFLRKHCGREVEFRVYVVEQSADDGLKFNRGKLLNIGFDLARAEGCRSFVFHDVDLLPSDELGRWYSERPDRPVHIARVWKQYSKNPKYFGGVVSFSQEDFEKINGFPNTFWGWGGEDDEMYSRIVEVQLEPQNAEEGDFTDLEGLNLETKLVLLRKNEKWKCQVKNEALEEHSKTWRQNGLKDLKYKVVDRTPLAERTEKVTVDVQLNGHWTDTITHWRDLDKRNKS